MRKKIFAGSLLVLLLTFSGMASAQSGQAPKPFSETEFNQFLDDYSSLSQWLTKKGRFHGDTLRNPWIMTGMRYDKDFNGQLKAKGWESERFFYLLDHINVGLLTSRAEADQAAAKSRWAKQAAQMKAQLDAQKKKLAEQSDATQKRLDDQMAKFQKSMDAQNKAWAERRKQQLAAEKARIQNNPNIPPMQKQQILAQMDRSQKLANQKPQTQEEIQAKWSAQQRARMEQQKKIILNNPNIPPQQKQQIIAQIERSMAPVKKYEPPKQTPLDPKTSLEDMHAHKMVQHKEWLKMQMQKVQNNPNIHPMQKRQMLHNWQQALERMDASKKRMQESFKRNQEANRLIPTEEALLIKQNRQKLTGLFFPER